MVGRAGKYALVNANLRARIGKLLPDDFFAGLLKCPSLEEMFNYLNNGPYSYLSQIYDATADLKSVELELMKKEALLLQDIKRLLPADIKGFCDAFTIGYEIENLKNALRLFFDRKFRKRPVETSVPYLLREDLIHRIPLDAVINSDSLNEIADQTSHTPYGAIIRKESDEVEKKQTLFPMSIALDRYYYNNLINEAEKLSASDRAIAGRLIGIEIDLQNINRIMRFRDYYNMPPDSVAASLIPGGRIVKEKMPEDLYRSDQAISLLLRFLQRNYPGIAISHFQQLHERQSKLAFIEILLERIMYKDAKHILCGYPFTIGIIIAYFILKRLEIRRIRTVLNAGFYGIDRKQVESLL